MGESPGIRYIRSLAQEPRAVRQRVRPASRRAAAAARSRRRVSSRCGEHAAQPIALELVVQPRVERIDVDRQPALAPEVVPDVLVAGLHVDISATPSCCGQRAQEALGVVGPGAVGMRLVGEERRVVPGRLAVRAPVAAERPARQLFARIPLALAEVHEARRRRSAAFSRHSSSAATQPLGRSERRRVPLGGVRVVDRDERRLAAHRQPHVAALRGRVDGAAERRRSPATASSVYGLVTRGDSCDALHRHRVLELDLALVDAAA